MDACVGAGVRPSADAITEQVRQVLCHRKPCTLNSSWDGDDGCDLTLATLLCRSTIIMMLTIGKRNKATES